MTKRSIDVQDRATTPDRVIDAAIGLFNERGTAAVSTNHIAAAAGISPGNLYYHYRNKEAIIRAVFTRLDAHWAASFLLPEDRWPSLDDLRAMVTATFEGVWAHRFMYRELAALTRRDPELATLYRALRQRGLDGTIVLLRAFHAAGVMVGPDHEEGRLRLALLVLLVADSWLPFEETGAYPAAHPDLHPIEEGTQMLMQVIEPWLTTPSPSGLAPNGHGGTTGPHPDDP